MNNYTFEPTRRIISVADARLNGLLLRNPERCATVSEYSGATGIDTGAVIELLGPYLEDGTLELEFVGDEIFVHTAPSGRPVPMHVAQVPPNLWEALRVVAPSDYAYGLWKLVRGLERSGWKVETQAAKINSGLARLEEPPFLGVWVGGVVVPVLIFPTSDALQATHGLLSNYNHAGASAVAVVCDNGALDETITAVRRWVLGQRMLPSLSVMILESPRYNPTLITPNDAAVSSRSVSRETLDSLDWASEDEQKES